MAGIHYLIGRRYPDDMPTTDFISPQPRRFTIQLPRPLWTGLATSVLVVLGVGLRVGLPIYRNATAIREIERVGGEVGKVNGGREFLRRWFGDYRMTVFDEAASVTLSATKINAADVVRMEAFPQLRTLVIDETEVAATDFVHLSRLKSLRKLFLSGEQITDSHLAHLKALPKLASLHLLDTRVSDSAVAELQKASPALVIRVRR